MTPEEEKLDEQKDSTPEKAGQASAESTWEHDQKSKGYYYDDTCGYEVFDPELDDDEKDEGASS